MVDFGHTSTWHAALSSSLPSPRELISVCALDQVMVDPRRVYSRHSITVCPSRGFSCGSSRCEETTHPTTIAAAQQIKRSCARRMETTRVGVMTGPHFCALLRLNVKMLSISFNGYNILFPLQNKTIHLIDMQFPRHAKYLIFKLENTSLVIFVKHVYSNMHVAVKWSQMLYRRVN